MKTYPWFDQVPEHLKTRNQLAQQGLRPGGPVVARVVWRQGRRWADLYDVATAKPKRIMTEAQAAALSKAQQALRTCKDCGTVFGYVLPWRFDCPVCEEQGRSAERLEAAQTAWLWLRSPRTVILDTETTGLDGYLVQLAIIQALDGAVLLDQLIDPQSPIEPGAQQVHGITEDRLVGMPTFVQLADQITGLLHSRRVVTYNAAFDSGILWNEVARLHHTVEQSGYRRADAWRKSVRWRCAMELYAQYVGDWSDYHGDYRWQPLPGGDHSALGDAQACRRVLQRMAERALSEEET